VIIMAEKLSPEDRKSAILFTAGCSVFAVLGVLIAVIMRPSGIGLLGPILVGPGITIFLFGALYDSSLGPLMGISSDEFTDKLRYAYMGLGGLFMIMGFFAWVLG